MENRFVVIVVLVLAIGLVLSFVSLLVPIAPYALIAFC